MVIDFVPQSSTHLISSLAAHRETITMDQISLQKYTAIIHILDVIMKRIVNKSKMKFTNNSLTNQRNAAKKSKGL